MNGLAFAGHAGGMGPGSMLSLMPHEIVMLIAAMALIILILCLALAVTVRRLSRLERHLASMEKIDLERSRAPRPSEPASPIQR
jgi:hypothetical protein